MTTFARSEPPTRFSAAVPPFCSSGEPPSGGSKTLICIRGTEAVEVYVGAVILVAAAAILVASFGYAGILTSRERFGTLARLSVAGFGLQALLTVLLVPHFRIIDLALASWPVRCYKRYCYA